MSGEPMQHDQGEEIIRLLRMLVKGEGEARTVYLEDDDMTDGMVKLGEQLDNLAETVEGLARDLAEKGT